MSGAGAGPVSGGAGRPGSGRSGGHRLLDRYPRARRRDVPYRHQLLRVGDRSVAWVPPLVLLVGIVALDYVTPANFRIMSWLVLVPGIAAAICGVTATVVYAVLAPVTYVIAENALPDQYQAGLADLILAALGGILAVIVCVVRVRGENRMVRMRAIADTTRRTVLRALPPGFGGLDHAFVHLAADAEARVGGDFYDIQPGPYGSRVLLGDVQGKGLAAVDMAAALLGTFREAGYHEADLRTIAARLELRMRRHRARREALGLHDGDRFATAILLGFPPDPPDAVDMIIFGHEPPLVVGPQGVRELAPGDTLPLGLAELVPPAGPPPVRRVVLGDGETLLMTTDGVTEARDREGVFYPLAAEVAAAVAVDVRVAEPGRLVAFVRDGTLRHSGGRLADDTTVFAVRRTRAGRPR